MNTSIHTTDHATAEAHHDADAKVIFGFWLYIMTDCLLFASLFAVYAVLRNNTFGGADGSELFSLPFVLVETMILLTSSFTAGLGMLAAHHGRKNDVVAWFTVTFLLGAFFIGMELHEFAGLAAEGHDWTKSGFLSAFFSLVGTHGLHVFSGMLWMLLLLVQIVRKGLSETNLRRLVCLSLFWHFLDIVWIFIFTFVYLISQA